MATGADYILIDKLVSSNYATWRDDIKVVLMEKGLWEYVTIKAPLTADSKEVDDAMVAKRTRAYSIIYLNVSKEYRPLLSGISDPYLAWEALERQFRPNNRARIVELTDSFFECKLQPDEDLNLYGARLKNIIEQLQDAGRPISEWLKPFQLIRHLPSEYSGIVQVIYRFPDSDFTFENVLNELLSEEARIKVMTNQNTSNINCNYKEVALHADNKFGHKSKYTNKHKFNFDNMPIKLANHNTNFRRSNDCKKCFVCGMTNHLAKNCSNVKGKNRNKQYESGFVAEACFSSDSNSTAWLFDTAASSHFCSRRDLFWDFQPISGMEMKAAINGVACEVLGKGTVKFDCKMRGENHRIVLYDVLYSPNLRHNLMAGHRFEERGASFVGKGGRIDIFHKNGKKLFSAFRRKGLYYVFPNYVKRNNRSNDRLEINHINTEGSLELWHRRFCHVNKDYILNSVQKVRGLPPLKNEEFNCEPCKIGKAKQVSFKPIGKIRSVKTLELLHLDVAGPINVKTRAGNRYFLSIIDDFSRRVCVYLMKEKSEVFECFVKFQKRAERFTGNKILNLKSDNGMEFCSNLFEEYLENNGIKHEKTNIHTPMQNGVAEKFNHTAMNAVRTLLNESKLAERFWGGKLYCALPMSAIVCVIKILTEHPLNYMGGEYLL